jgi:hypothetical protein
MSTIPLGFWKRNQEIIKTNLIFYYDPANSSSYIGSGTTLNDLSLNSYTATINGGGFGFSSTDGMGSLIFDGVRHFITVPSGSAEPFMNQSFTLEAWLKPETSPPAEQIFFSISQTATTNSRLHCRLYSDGRIRFAYFVNDLDTSTNQVNFGDWHHIAMRYRLSDDTSTTFLNGIQLAQGNQGPLLPSTNRVVRIGDWNGSQRFKGSIGAIYAYQNDQTDAQIIANYNSLKSRYGL